MEIHLVDATYELFRAHFSPRPRVRGRDGADLTAVAGLAETILTLLRDEGATHVGCATDHVIASFRNDLYAGYKTDAGVPAELLAQFPLAEEALDALGVVVWPMTDLEADDALATAAARWGDHAAVDRILICTPDKDLAQCVRDDRVVLRDRRRDVTYDDAGVREKWGVAPGSVADRLALVGRRGRRVPRPRQAGGRAPPRRCSPVTGGSRRSRATRPTGTCRCGGRRASRRRCATGGTTRSSSAPSRRCAPTPPLPQREPDELAWRGAPRERWEGFCAANGLPRLAGRPHRWASGS